VPRKKRGPLWPPDVLAMHNKARRALHAAIASGRVSRVTVCERCGRHQHPFAPPQSVWGVQAHHEDYTKPLAVAWLCHWCHMTANIATRKRLLVEYRDRSPLDVG
jgi:hypothetical protein